MSSSAMAMNVRSSPANADLNSYATRKAKLNSDIDSTVKLAKLCLLEKAFSRKTGTARNQCSPYSEKAPVSKYREYDQDHEDHTDDPETTIAVITAAASPVAAASEDDEKNDDDKKYAHSGASLKRATCAPIRDGSSPLFANGQLRQRFHEPLMASLREPGAAESKRELKLPPQLHIAISKGT
jgi:hypothetical protein